MTWRDYSHMAGVMLWDIFDFGVEDPSMVRHPGQVCLDVGGTGKNKR